MFDWMRELLKLETFSGAVFATIIGTIATALLGWLSWVVQRAYRRQPWHTDEYLAPAGHRPGYP